MPLIANAVNGDFKRHGDTFIWRREFHRVGLQRGFTPKYLASDASYGSLHRTFPLLPSLSSDDYMDSSSDDELDPCDDYSAVAGILGTSPSMRT